MYIGLHGKCTFFLSNFNPTNAELNPVCHLLALLGSHHILHVSRIRVNETSVFSVDFRKIHFMKIRLVGAELFHVDRRTDITKLTVTFRNFVNVPTD